MFCPIRASKSWKSTHSQTTRSRDATGQNNNNGHLNNNANNNDNLHATSAPYYRYVKTDYRMMAQDELSVSAGDRVLYEYTVKDWKGDEWSHVFCLKTNKEGFVPSEILSTEPVRVSQCKKKLPRLVANQGIESHHLQTHHLHHNKHHDIGKPSSHGDTMTGIQHQHIHEHHQPRFGMSHSLHGSSGKQSFPKFMPDLRRHLSPPAYYNVRSSEHPHHYERYDMECRRFHREDHGLFVVTNNFVAREENDLNVRPADYVRVLNKEDEDWYWVRREYDLVEGFVPSRFICDYEHCKSILNKGNSTVTTKSSNHIDFHTYINHRPDRESLPTDQQSSVLQPI